MAYSSQGPVQASSWGNVRLDARHQDACYARMVTRAKSLAYHFWHRFPFRYSRPGRLLNSPLTVICKPGARGSPDEAMAVPNRATTQRPGKFYAGAAQGNGGYASDAHACHGQRGGHEQRRGDRRLLSVPLPLLSPSSRNTPLMSRSSRGNFIRTENDAGAQNQEHRGIPRPHVDTITIL